MADSQGSKRARPFPKLKRVPGQAGHDALDKERIKLEYLAQEHYGWEAFCVGRGYKPSLATRQLLPFAQWQREWMELQSSVFEENTIPKAMSVREYVVNQRLEYPKRWGKAAQDVQNLNEFMLRKMSLQAKHDFDHEKEIAEGKVKPLVNWKAHELSVLARSMATVQEIHRHALLIPFGDAEKRVINLPERDAESMNENAEQQRLQGMEVAIKGKYQVASPEDLTRMLAGWYDQAPAAADGLKTPAELADGPLDSLEDDDDV